MKAMYVLVVGFLFVLVGCASPKKEVLILSINRDVNTSHIAIIVALKEGFYEKEGLDVRLVHTDQRGSLSSILKEEVDLAISSQGELTFIVDKGAPLISIAALFIHNPRGLYSLENSGISSPVDLQDKVFGGYGGNVEKTVINTLIKNSGIPKPSFKVQVIGDSDVLTSLRSVDFVWGFRSWQGIQLQLARTPFRFLPFGKYVPVLNTYSPIIVANTQSSLYKDNPNKIRRFLNATEMAARWAKAHNKRAIRAIRNYDKSLSTELLYRSLNVLFPRMLTNQGEWGVQDIRRYRNFIQFFQEKGLLSNNVKAENIFSNKFLAPHSRCEHSDDEQEPCMA